MEKGMGKERTSTAMGTNLEGSGKTIRSKSANIRLARGINSRESSKKGKWGSGQ